MEHIVYTIGHSNHSIEHFVSLVKQAGISAIADVRSSPYSRIHSQFNREPLKETLRREGVQYVFVGKELGARPQDRSCYRDDIAEYALIEKSALFKKGIDRVVRGAETFRIALMCAEKEPLDCHRTVLVSRKFASQGIRIRHILADGRIENHSETEKRLLTLTHQESADLFAGDPLERAYEIRGREICFKGQRQFAGSVGEN